MASKIAIERVNKKNEESTTTIFQPSQPYQLYTFKSIQIPILPMSHKADDIKTTSKMASTTAFGWTRDSLNHHLMAKFTSDNTASNSEKSRGKSHEERAKQLTRIIHQEFPFWRDYRHLVQRLFEFSKGSLVDHGRKDGSGKGDEVFNCPALYVMGHQPLTSFEESSKSWCRSDVQASRPIRRQSNDSSPRHFSISGEGNTPGQ